MNGQNCAFASLAVLLVTAAATGAEAQSLTPTAVQGVSVFPAPPKGFNAATATGSQLATYGIPPAPNSSTASKAYNAWVRAAAYAANRQAAAANKTNVYNGPASIHGVASPDRANSLGWSGTSIVASKGTFSNEEIQASFTIPTAQPAPGSCGSASARNAYASQWIGIDGNGSTDVLQAGVELIAKCYNGVVTASYAPWIEWYPNSLVQVSSPVITPGDFVQVSVWPVSPNMANVSFVDETTGISATYQLKAPSGVSLVGNSIEWIVEHPTVADDPLALFANYTVSSWSGGLAWNYKQAKPTYFYSGQTTPPAGTFQTINMVDPLNNVMSTPTVVGQDFIMFQAY